MAQGRSLVGELGSHKPNRVAGEAGTLLQRGAPRAQSLSPGLQASLASGHGFCGQGLWMFHLVRKLHPETVVS